MDIFTPRKLRPWALATLAVRGVIRLLELWPLLLILGLYVSPVQPHLRWQYRYIPNGSDKIMIDCDYLGPRGFIKYRIGTRCPVIVVLDARKPY
ncbi:MAG: hypothetical protein L0Y57_07495 [Beijerinckiaceae bacterium]|nr:hypothetical protein [Beijerinckiaceae bacterium]